MPSPIDTLRSPQNWIYASLTVIDGGRQLKPAQVAFDRLLFDNPPRLKSAQVEIILQNGDSEYRRFAKVLAHDPDARRIPIELLANH